MISEPERLARLEAEMRQVQADINEIKDGVKNLADIAATGIGFFRAILMVGGVVGSIIGLFTLFYKHS